MKKIIKLLKKSIGIILKILFVICKKSNFTSIYNGITTKKIPKKRDIPPIFTISSILVVTLLPEETSWVKWAMKHGGYCSRLYICL